MRQPTDETVKLKISKTRHQEGQRTPVAFMGELMPKPEGFFMLYSAGVKQKEKQNWRESTTKADAWKGKKAIAKVLAIGLALALAMVVGDDTEIKVTSTRGLGKEKWRRKFSSDLGKCYLRRRARLNVKRSGFRKK